MESVATINSKWMSIPRKEIVLLHVELGEPDGSCRQRRLMVCIATLDAINVIIFSLSRDFCSPPAVIVHIQDVQLQYAYSLVLVGSRLHNKLNNMFAGKVHSDNKVMVFFHNFIIQCGDIWRCDKNEKIASIL